MATLAVWPQLGTTVTLEDGVTVIDEDGAVVVLTQEISDLLRAGRLLDYDPRSEPNTDPDEPPSGHAADHILGGVQEIDGDKLAIDVDPPGYASTVNALAPDVRHLGAHLQGIGIALDETGTTADDAWAKADAAETTANAALAGLESVPSVMSYDFSHPAFSVAAATTRRLWTGYEASAAWVAADGWKPRYVIPDAGELVSLTAQHGVHTGGPSNISYTVWKSSDNGVSWQATALTVTRLSSGAGFVHIAASVPVDRGELIGVEAICAGAATGTDRLIASVLYKRGVP